MSLRSLCMLTEWGKRGGKQYTQLQQSSETIHVSLCSRPTLGPGRRPDVRRRPIAAPAAALEEFGAQGTGPRPSEAESLFLQMVRSRGPASRPPRSD